MKLSATHLLGATALAAILFSASCKKDDNSNNNGGGGGGGGTQTSTLSFSLGGATYSFSGDAQVSCLTQSGNSYYIAANAGTSGGKPGVALTIKPLTAPGAFTLPLTTDTASIAVLQRFDQISGGIAPTYNSMKASTVPAGTITVTEFDAAAKHIKGSFQFTGGAVGATGASGEAVVSEGKFEVYGWL